MLQECAPHLQGWHHPLRSLQSNSPSLHLQGWKPPLPLRIGLAFAPPLTTFSHWQPLPVTHQSLLAPGPIQHNLSPPPVPPAADSHLHSLPTGLSWPAPSTGQHQSLMKTRATSSNGTNCEPTPSSPLPRIPPMQTNWVTYAKALAPGPMRASVLKAPTSSFPFLTSDPSQPPQGNHLLQGCLQSPTKEGRQR
jgi:hypothetical protein